MHFPLTVFDLPQKEWNKNSNENSNKLDSSEFGTEIRETRISVCITTDVDGRGKKSNYRNVIRKSKCIYFDAVRFKRENTYWKKGKKKTKRFMSCFVLVNKIKSARTYGSFYFSLNGCIFF